MPTSKASPSKRERKKENDRNSQRAARERTRQYIAHLEDIVDAAQSAGNGSIDQLVKRYHDALSENRRLNAALARIKTILESFEIEMPSARIEYGVTESRANESSANALETECASGSSQELHSATPTPTNVFETKSSLGISISPLSVEEQATMWWVVPGDVSNPQPPKAKSLPQTLEEGPPYVVEGLNTAFRLVQPFRVSTESTEDDIAVRAVLHGWDVVESLHTIDSGWQFLKLIDSILFSQCGQIERLAILHGLRFRLRCAFDTSFCNFESLPHFLLPRPIEVMREHLPLNDYLIWPELREYYILNGCFIDNEQALLFAKHIRFDWPFSFRDAYLENRMTGQYSMSRYFDARCKDIGNWSLASSFFEVHPEYVGVIPHSMDPRV